MSLIIDEHREYLRDAARLRVFERAIAAVVRPGAVVLDLASGSGILGFFACRAGARRVYAIDNSGMNSLARGIAQANGLSDRMVWIDRHSQHAELPERVDAIVSDIIGRIGFLSGGAEALIDARNRWLAPGGSIMPAIVHTWAAPVDAASVYANVDFWRGTVSGFDLSSVRPAAASTGYPHTFSPGDLLADAARLTSCDYRTGTADVVRGTSSFVVQRAGLLHGIAAWFTAELAPGVTATNAPGDPDRITRRHAFLPFERPVAVLDGDRIDVSLTIRPLDFIVSWGAVCRRGGRTLDAFRQSTLQGMLLPASQLRSGAEDARPRLNAWAAARGTVLALCDGQRTVREVEDAVFDRHRALFPDRTRAQIFVAEVLSRYGDAPAPTAS